MAMYAFRGRSGGAVVSGEIEANDRPTAVTALRARGVVATSVQERTAKPVGIKKIGGKVKDKDLWTAQTAQVAGAAAGATHIVVIESTMTTEKVGKKPKKFFFALSSGGSAGHVATLEFLRRTKLPLDTVLYKGTAGEAALLYPQRRIMAICGDRGKTILSQRERIKRKTIEQRRLQHRKAAA